MAYCNNCGKEISDYAATCPECGAPQQPKRATTVAVDNGGFGWGLLGFCIPLVGIILYFVWKDEKPNTAKVLIQWALISIGINIFFTIVSSCMGAFAY
jgi:uncharacterized membrane protein YvbJ